MINLAPLAPQCFMVVGLAKAGLAACHALHAAHVPFYAWDDGAETRAAFPYPEHLKNPLETPLPCMPHALVLSPGIPHHLPEAHPMAVWAQRHNIPIICDTDLLFQALPAAPVVGITGTNGKSTTTALLDHILKADRPTQTGGNLGQPSLSLTGDTTTHFVIEFSSFMLERVPHLKADIAIHLNFTPDHFDRHGDMQGYIKAKAHLFEAAKGTGKAFIGVDDPESEALYQSVLKAGIFTVTPVSVKHPLENGYWVDAQGTLHQGANKLLPLNTHAYLKGAHNWQNMAFAYAACTALGVPSKTIETQVFSFKGLPHRQFLVRRMGQVSYINDSKATNADATVQALAAYQNIYWLAGGKPKDGGLQGCEPYFTHVKKAYLFGYAAKSFAAFCAAHNLPHHVFETMAEATRAAHADAQKASAESCVLLSPACASYDQFKNFEQRGDLFAELVQTL